MSGDEETPPLNRADGVTPLPGSLRPPRGAATAMAARRVKSRPQKVGSMQTWLRPALAASAFVVVIGLLLAVIRHREMVLNHRDLIDDSNIACASVRRSLRASREFLDHLSRELVDGSLTPQKFQSGAACFLAGRLDVNRVVWVAPDMTVHAVAIPAADCGPDCRRDAVPQQPEQHRIAQVAETKRQPVYSRPFEASDGRRVVELWTPAITEGQVRGLLVCRFVLEELLHQVISPDIHEESQVSLIDATGRIVVQAPPSANVHDALSHQIPIDEQGTSLSLRLDRYDRGMWDSRLVSMTLLCLTLALTMAYGMWRQNLDIVERQQAEDSLRQSEAQLRLLLDQMPAILWTTDIQLRITSIVGAGLDAVETEPEDLVGENVAVYLKTGDRQSPAMLAHRRAAAGEQVSYEMERDERVFQALVQPLINERSKIIGTIGIALDDTERKQEADRRAQFEVQLQHAQKLESLGVLAGSIAHDFNNLLMGILGYADLTLLDLPPDSPAYDNIKHISTIADQLADLCRQLLAYSGRGKVVVQTINLSKIVEEMTHLLEISISKKAKLRYSFARPLPAIDGDATQLRQVIMNLITNASDALRGSSGVITVSTGSMHVDAKDLAETFLSEELDPGTYVYLEVADTGHGMDEATKARIFDPFFTTKVAGRGLGLASVLGIVRGHHGAVRVDSQPGKGTTFRVLFRPSLPFDAPKPDSSACLPVFTGTLGSGAVLVIDDEEAVRAVARRTLEQFGLVVLTANDGHTGVETFRAHSDAIIAVLLDLTMPTMNGEEVFRAIRAIRPEVQVILSSGFSEQEATNLFQEDELSGFLQKPYRPMDLVQILHERLGV